MKVHRLVFKQVLPISKEQAWEFFSSPKSLAVITPEKMNFKIVSLIESTIYPRQIINYEVSVFPVWRTHWETEITEVIPFKCFVDVQRKGPYAYWHHRHTFTEVDGGIEMTDELDYAVPLGWLGRLANNIYVERELKSIFTYRFHKLNSLFTGK